MEQTAFSLSFKVAGTVDLIGRNRETGNLAILDWKTNREIEEANDYPTERYGFPPVGFMPNSNFWHYTLQLNLYRVLLWLEKYYPCKDAEMAFFHIKPMHVERYDLERFDKEISLILAANKDKEFDPHEKAEIEALFA